MRCCGRGQNANDKWSSISFPSVSSLARLGGQGRGVVFAGKGVSGEGLLLGSPGQGGVRSRGAKSSGL